MQTNLNQTNLNQNLKDLKGSVDKESRLSKLLYALNMGAAALPFAALSFVSAAMDNFYSEDMTSRQKNNITAVVQAVLVFASPVLALGSAAYENSQKSKLKELTGKYDNVLTAMSNILKNYIVEERSQDKKTVYSYILHNIEDVSKNLHEAKGSMVHRDDFVKNLEQLQEKIADMKGITFTAFKDELQGEISDITSGKGILDLVNLERGKTSNSVIGQSVNPNNNNYSSPRPEYNRSNSSVTLNMESRKESGQESGQVVSI